MMFIVELLAILSIALMVFSPCGLICALFVTQTKKKHPFDIASDMTVISLMIFLAGVLGMSFAAGIYSTVS